MHPVIAIFGESMRPILDVGGIGVALLPVASTLLGWTYGAGTRGRNGDFGPTREFGGCARAEGEGRFAIAVVFERVVHGDSFRGLPSHDVQLKMRSNWRTRRCHSL